jgi:Ser/Thr protein kinase RdoA (MazF antagonist)
MNHAPQMPPLLNESASAELVSTLLDRALSERAVGLHERCRVVGPLQQRETAVLFRAEHPWFGRPVLVRICKGLEDHPVIEARRRFDVLERTGAAMGGDTRFNVPKTYPLLVDNGCEIMEWIDGRNLNHILFHPATHPLRIVAGIGLAGQWLRQFHHAHGTDSTLIDIAGLSKTIQNVVGAAPNGFSTKPAVRSALAFLDENAASVVEQPVARSRHHGDFKPENVIVTDDRVVGIDFETASEAECLRDIVNFLFMVDIALSNPKAWRLAPARQKIRLAFLAGYAGGDTLDPLPIHELVPFQAFKWLRVHRALREWAFDAARRPSGLRGRYLDASYRRLVTAVLAETPQDWQLA